MIFPFFPMILPWFSHMFQWISHDVPLLFLYKTLQGTDLDPKIFGRSAPAPDISPGRWVFGQKNGHYQGGDPEKCVFRTTYTDIYIIVQIYHIDILFFQEHDDQL
jgi:hypothetical protein